MELPCEYTMAHMTHSIQNCKLALMYWIFSTTYYTVETMTGWQSLNLTLKGVFQVMTLLPDLKCSQPSSNVMESVSYHTMPIIINMFNLFFYCLVQTEEGTVQYVGNLCLGDCRCLDTMINPELYFGQIAAHFARTETPELKGIAVALFQCIESMQCFNHKGYLIHYIYLT